MTAMKVWLLPEPLSPTTPRVSPRGDRQRDAAHRVDHAVVGVEVDRRSSRVRTAGGDVGKGGLGDGRGGDLSPRSWLFEIAPTHAPL